MRSGRSHFILAVMVASTLSLGWALAQAQPSRPPSGQGNTSARAYVANETSGTVAVINTATNAVETIICLGSDPPIANTPQPAGPCNAEPQHHSPFYNGHVGAHGLWLTPDGKVLLVANRISGTVAAIDTSQIGASPAPVLSIPPEDAAGLRALIPGYQPTGREPHLATVRPGGREAWVAVRGEEHIDVLSLDYRRLFDEERRRTDRMRLMQTIDTMNGPSMVSFTSDGKYAFVVSGKEGRVDKIQADSGHIVASQIVPFPFSPFGLVSPDDQELYIIHKNQGGQGRLSVLRTDDLSYVVPGLVVGPCANHVYFVGRFAYITIGGTPPCAPGGTDREGKIVIFDRNTHAVARELTGPAFTGDPHGIWGTPDGRKLFVGHERAGLPGQEARARVSVINTGDPNNAMDDSFAGVVTASTEQMNLMKQPIDVVVAGAGPGTASFVDSAVARGRAAPPRAQASAIPPLETGVVASASTAVAVAPTSTTVASTPTVAPTNTPTSMITPLRRDVAVTRVSAPTLLAEGSAAVVQVEVQNQGSDVESFSVALTRSFGARTELVGTEEVADIPPGQGARLMFQIPAIPDGTRGEHLLIASVSELPGEVDLSNNRQVAAMTVVNTS